MNSLSSTATVSLRPCRRTVVRGGRSCDDEARARRPLAQLGQNWWIFAASGTGDAWLMSLDGQQRIGFLDHDQGAEAVAQPMALNFGQWLQLADLMGQWEAMDDDLDDEAVAQLSRLMEQISHGLSRRYPYAF